MSYDEASVEQEGNKMWKNIRTALELVTILLVVVFALIWRGAMQDMDGHVLAAGEGRPTGKGVTVAVIDTGLNVDFVGAPKNIAEGRYYFFMEEEDGPYMLDGYGDRRYGYYSNDYVEDHTGHGTVVAAIIAHYAPDVTIMPIKNITNRPGYVSGTSSTVIDCIDYAIDNGADVINMSFSLTGGYSLKVEEAVKRAADAGCIIIASVGNEGTSNVQYPAAYPGVIGVGAVDDYGAKAIWSNYGEWVDIYARGAEVEVVEDTITKRDGTSYSAPMVCAAAALALEADPDMTSEEFLDLLKASSDPVAGYQSAGALNLDRFLTTKREEIPSLIK